MAKTIKDLTDERIVEKLQEYHEKMAYWERNAVNYMFNHNYIKACNNYMRYLREWTRRDLYEKTKFEFKRA